MLDAAALTGHRRRYNPILDELGRPLRVSPGLVDHADQLTRLDRGKGASTVFISHPMAGLEALANEEDRAKACGFAERYGVTVLAALPQRKLARVDEVVPMSAAERDLVASWAHPPAGIPPPPTPAAASSSSRPAPASASPPSLRTSASSIALTTRIQCLLFPLKLNVDRWPSHASAREPGVGPLSVAASLLNSLRRSR